MTEAEKMKAVRKAHREIKEYDAAGGRHRLAQAAEAAQAADMPHLVALLESIGETYLREDDLKTERGKLHQELLEYVYPIDENL